MWRLIVLSLRSKKHTENVWKHLHRDCQAILGHREISTMATHLGCSSFPLKTVTSHNAYVYRNQIIMISNSIMESCWDFMLQMILILCVLMYYSNYRWHSESPKCVNSPTSIMLQRETCWRPCRPASNHKSSPWNAGLLQVIPWYSHIKGPEVGPE